MPYQHSHRRETQKKVQCLVAIVWPLGLATEETRAC